VDVAQDITEPLLICESVLSETAFHLGNAEIVLEMIAEDNRIWPTSA